MEGRKKREMTPEMLEKLAVARAKAQEVRKQIKAEKDAKAIDELPAKLEKQAKIKEELNKPKAPKPETRKKKPIPEENPVMDSPSSDSDDYDFEPAPEPPKPEKKKKKKQVVIMEDSSSDEEQFIYVPKRKGKPKKELPPPEPEPAPAPEPPKRVQPQMPTQMPQPTYNDLARQGMYRFGGMGRF